MPLASSFSLPSTYTTPHVILALFSGAALALTIRHHLESHDYHFRPPPTSIPIPNNATALLSLLSQDPKSNHPDKDDEFTPPTGEGLQSAIGNTPLILLPHLSALTHSKIYAKLELLNPGGSPKDRVALSILNALSTPDPSNPSSPVLRAGDTVYEGTVGSTGISLAGLCRSRGITAHIVMPSDVAREKGELLLKLGAKVTKVPPAPIVDRAHFVNVARRLAATQTQEYEDGVEITDKIVSPDGKETYVTRKKWSGRGWFADQFERDANWQAHYYGTGREIYTQIQREGGNIDAFVAGAGTGGTISGVGLYLKDHVPKTQDQREKQQCQVILADPQGSGLYNKVKHGVFWSPYEKEGTRRREQVDTVIEGIGLVRSTRNWEVGFEKGVVDDAVKVSDQGARNMARWLVEREGLWVGGSSAVNCVAAVKTALRLGPGRTIVTIICDSGARHQSKFWAQIGEIGGEAKVELDDILEGREIR